MQNPIPNQINRGPAAVSHQSTDRSTGRKLDEAIARRSTLNVTLSDIESRSNTPRYGDDQLKASIMKEIATLDQTISRLSGQGDLFDNCDDSEL